MSERTNLASQGVPVIAAEFRPSFIELVRRVVPGFEGGRKWKVVRHMDSRPGAPDLMELLRTNRSAFEIYQADQAQDVFGKCEGVFAFIGLPGRRALFAGAWFVTGVTRSLSPSPDDVPVVLRPLYQHIAKDEPRPESFQYALQHDMRFAQLERRVVIDWGRGAINWHQWDVAKTVVGFRDEGAHEPCPDYGDIDLTLGKFADIVKNAEANSTWQQKLSAVGGIYLLSDRRRHRLYVGQASGADGFWGRWQAYARMNTGNLGVDEAFRRGEIGLEDAWMSILQVVPLGHGSQGRLNELETRWKVRLRSREKGLNMN